jgi:hypothetical protein
VRFQPYGLAAWNLFEARKLSRLATKHVHAIALL